MNWCRSVWSAFHANDLTRARRDVLLTLESYARASPGGVPWPSHATLAARARCSERTVRRALAIGRKLGLVSWVSRWIPSAWRALRASNHYVLHGFSIAGHGVRGVESQKQERGIEASRPGAPPGSDARILAKFIAGKGRWTLRKLRTS